MFRPFVGRKAPVNPAYAAANPGHVPPPHRHPQPQPQPPQQPLPQQQQHHRQQPHHQERHHRRHPSSTDTNEVTVVSSDSEPETAEDELPGRSVLSPHRPSRPPSAPSSSSRSHRSSRNAPTSTPAPAPVQAQTIHNFINIPADMALPPGIPFVTSVVFHTPAYQTRAPSSRPESVTPNQAVALPERPSSRTPVKRPHPDRCDSSSQTQSVANSRHQPHMDQPSTASTPSSVRSDTGRPAAAAVNQPDLRQQYDEKMQQVSHFIEPLKNMIQRIENGLQSSTLSVDNLRKVYANISAPGGYEKGLSYETLIKVESFLKRIDFQQGTIAPNNGTLQQGQASSAAAAAGGGGDVNQVATVAPAAVPAVPAVIPDPQSVRNNSVQNGKQPEPQKEQNQTPADGPVKNISELMNFLPADPLLKRTNNQRAQSCFTRCEYCDGIFGGQTLLNEHRESEHSQRIGSNINPEAVYMCNICVRRYTREASLMMHMRDRHPPKTEPKQETKQETKLEPKPEAKTKTEVKKVEEKMDTDEAKSATPVPPAAAAVPVRTHAAGTPGTPVVRKRKCRNPEIGRDFARRSRNQASGDTGLQPFACKYCPRIIGDLREMENHILIDHDDKLLVSFS